MTNSSMEKYLINFYKYITPNKIRSLKSAGLWIKVVVTHSHNSGVPSHTHSTNTFYLHKNHLPHISFLTNYFLHINTNVISYKVNNQHIHYHDHTDSNDTHYHTHGTSTNHHHHGTSTNHHHHGTNDHHHHSGSSVVHTHGTATTDASNNLSLGTDALKSLTTGTNNCGIGYDALHDITSGSNNLAIGNEALANLTIGNSNVAIGSKSLYNNIDGDSNTCIGYEAGMDVNGDNNVVIGRLADTSAPNSSNEIVIGYNAVGIGSNVAVIGNDNVTKLYAAHDGGAVIYAQGIVHTSDSRIKANVNDLNGGLDFINSLRPVTYTKVMPKDYPDEIRNKMYPKGVPREISEQECCERQIGLIAQEVNNNKNLLGEDITNIVNYNIDTGLYSLSYDKFVVPLIKAIQELKKETDEKIQEIMTKIN